MKVTNVFPSNKMMFQPAELWFVYLQCDCLTACVCLTLSSHVTMLPDLCSDFITGINYGHKT